MAAVYSDSSRYNEDDNEVSIDTQPVSLNISANTEKLKALTLEATTPAKRMICVMALDEYGIYRDEEENAHATDGRIINVSKDDMRAILEMVDIMGGFYMSLPKYERCFQMPRDYHDPCYHHKPKTYRRDQVEDMIDDIVTAHERMFDDFCRRLYATCYPLNNNIGWLSKCMEELELKVD